MRNIKIIGTSHIAKESKEVLKKYILTEKPDIVALELDNVRFRSLFKRRGKIRLRDFKGLGMFGGLFGYIGARLQKQLGSRVGMKPGIDMKTAALSAKKIGARIFLIDRPLGITLQRLSSQMTAWEKIRLFFYILFGGFSRENRKWIKKIDLSKVPPEELVVKITKQLKKKFPTLYKILVDERNTIMAKNLKLIHKKFPSDKIVVVIGAGHKKAIEKLLK